MLNKPEGAVTHIIDSSTRLVLFHCAVPRKVVVT